ncbi:MAG TPA: glycosyltransferase [Candidatus Limnocylindria bacterium]|nr:glycosyltransferase [Candidatus Limnocylindria bacterium]
MTRLSAPPDVQEAARRRSEARAAQDWASADALRAEIEAAGWKVVDSGTSYRLEPGSPADVEVGGEIRYGRSDAVPSRLDEPAMGLASVVIVVSPDAQETLAALRGLRAAAPLGVDVVLVADGLSDRTLEPMRADLAAPADAGEGTTPVELIRTSAVLGQGAALNIGVRRASAPIVIALDPSITPTGDVVTPLVAALDDSATAIAGPFGLASGDLRRFDEVVPTAEGGPVDVAAVQGYLMAFRRADAARLGPLDEGFRFYRNLDIWWSLVLRDGEEVDDPGQDEPVPPRRAVAVPGLPLDRHEPHAWQNTLRAERDRLSKRNFYRILDRFRDRTDLAVVGAGSKVQTKSDGGARLEVRAR